jgi:hypothetical protein
MLLFWLCWAHFVADFPLQGDFLAMGKGKHWYLMLVHCAIWTGSCCIPLVVFDAFAWWKVGMFFVGHVVCDFWKCGWPRDEAHWWTMYPDQLFHATQLLVGTIDV